MVDMLERRRLKMIGETLKTVDDVKGLLRVWRVVDLRYIEEVERVCEIVILQQEIPLHGGGA